MGREMAARATAKAMGETARAFLPALSPELRLQAAFRLSSRTSAESGTTSPR